MECTQLTRDTKCMRGVAWCGASPGWHTVRENGEWRPEARQRRAEGTERARERDAQGRETEPEARDGKEDKGRSGRVDGAMYREG